MSQPLAAYEHNDRPVSAQAFYAIACDPRRSVVVQACAGAGKTWMLVSRLLRALLGGAKPQEILAITFTKKSAGEMRERLFEWLEQYARADAATLSQALKDRGITDENSEKPLSELIDLLSKLYQSLLDQDGQLQIRTFHSWFASLLRNAPISVLQALDLPLAYELLEDDAPAKAAVWRHFFAALLSDPQARADYEAVVYDVGRHQTEKALEAALDKRTEFLLADAQGLVKEAVLPFGQRFAAFAGLARPDDFFLNHAANRDVLFSAAKALSADAGKVASSKGAELQAALAAGDVDAMIQALLTLDGAPRQFSKKLAGLDQIGAAQDLAMQLANARHQHACWLFQQRMCGLTRLLLQSFAAIKRERGWVDMNDVERAASVLLGDPVLSAWLAERLDAQIRHLLIDEFQDTNPLQWHSLMSWLSAYAGAGSGPPSVFIVGDPKQSIYRFRRAEPQVFLAAQAFVQQALGGDVLTCDHTRRNAQSVLSVVNATMIDAARHEGYPGFRPHTTESADLGQVTRLPQVARHQPGTGLPEEVKKSEGEGERWRDTLSTPREETEDNLRTLEARQAARWIAQTLDQETKPDGSRMRASDVMVLSRRRAGLLYVQAELRKLGIAAQVGEKIELIDCCEVQDILALIDVLVSPQHDLSLARVLKSPLFSIGDDALVELAVQQQDAQTRQPTETPVPWIDLLQTIDLQSPDGRPVSLVLSRWKSWIDSLPPHDALQAIYSDGDVLARFASAAPKDERLSVQSHLRALLGASLEMDGGRYATPYAWVRKLKGGGVMAPVTANFEAVRLMTIHGAKGLEAHAVLLLDTDTQERNAQTMSVLVDWPGESAWPLLFVFLQSESRPPACASQALQNDLRERDREEINALYVALTRARHLLAISSIEPKNPAPRSWWSRLRDQAQDCDVVALPVPSPSQAVPQTPHFFIQELPMMVPGNTSPSDASEPAESGPKVGVSEAQAMAQNNAAIGLAMHRLLEWGAVSENNRMAVAREFGLTAQEGEVCARLAQRILQGQGAWAWDSSILAWQGNEVELMYQGEPLRIDRLVQRKDPDHADEWWVLDYKMASDPHEQSELMEQLSHYRDAVQAIYPDAVVKAAFLTGSGMQIELGEVA